MEQLSKISNGVKNIIFSPHLDDAILSCGGLIKLLAGDVLVVTVFSGDYQALTDWDKACGFKTNQRPIEIRRQEDKRALAKLGCYHYRHGDYLEEAVFNLAKSADSFKLFGPGADLAGFLENVIRADKEIENIYFPLGIKHPDHLRLRKAFVDLLKKKNFSEYNIYFYQDFPYLVDKTEHKKSLGEVKKDFVLRIKKINISSVLKDKVLAIFQYQSQIKPIFSKSDISQIEKSLLSCQNKIDYYFYLVLGFPKKAFENYWLIKNI